MWVLTTCILLHSRVGLLQGVRGRGTLRCRGAKGQRSVMPPQASPSPTTPMEMALWLHCPSQALWCQPWGRSSECLPCWGSPFSSPGPLVGWRLPPLAGGCSLQLAWGGGRQMLYAEGWEGLGRRCQSLAMRGLVGTHEGPGPGEGLWKVGERLSGGWSHPHCP